MRFWEEGRVCGPIGMGGTRCEWAGGGSRDPVEPAWSLVVWRGVPVDRGALGVPALLLSAPVGVTLLLLVAGVGLLECGAARLKAEE